MLKHDFQRSHSSTTIQSLLPLSNRPFLSGSGNDAAWSSAISRRNSVSTKTSRQGARVVLRQRNTSTGVKAVLTSASEKVTSVKAVVTVLQTVGGALTHLGWDRGLDDIADLLGRTLLVELVAAELDPSEYIYIYI